jgi:trans-2,3-dihydro-3-hydroxyanthranilate isomerase
VPHPYQLIDVFTNQPLSGNQLAVFLHGEAIDERMLQPLARELNLSETSFLYPPTSGGHARVRMFATWCELPFAGHPTLGTAFVVARMLDDNSPVVDVQLETDNGIVPVRVELLPDYSMSGWMNQPLPVKKEWTGDRKALLEILDVSDPIAPLDFYDNGVPHLFLRLSSIAEVLAIEPDFLALRDVCAGARINCFAGEGPEYTIRMFSPFELATPEDAACGSAAGPLAIHLFQHGDIESAQEIIISQGEKVGRPSTLLASVIADNGVVTNARVGGSCRLVGEGSFYDEIILRG